MVVIICIPTILGHHIATISDKADDLTSKKKNMCVN